MEGTNKAHENGEAMGLVGVRLTDQLGNCGQVNARLLFIALPEVACVVDARAGQKCFEDALALHVVDEAWNPTVLGAYLLVVFSKPLGVGAEYGQVNVNE